MNNLPESVMIAYGLHNQQLQIEPVGNGLINHTWKLKGKTASWILQKINTIVFPDPAKIEYNISALAAHLKLVNPGYLFTEHILTKEGRGLVKDKNEYYRLFSFIPDSHTINIVENVIQAEEAASQFGNFTKQLSGFDCSQLKITIHHFHDLSFRYKQFLQAITNGLPGRLQKADQLIQFLCAQVWIVNRYEDILKDPEFKRRVTHHDTKISNVLFHENNKGLCVIDLDTVMPGYFFSDLGDMFRTYLSPVNEDEKDIRLVTLRTDIYKAIVNGYISSMGIILTGKEKQHIYYAGVFMIYMQAIRFLTDYLNGDIYYQVKCPEHNFNRALNQIALLQVYFSYRKELENYYPEKL